MTGNKDISMVWETKQNESFPIAQFIITKAVVRRCSVKNLYLKISQNSQDDTCARGLQFC